MSNDTKWDTFIYSCIIVLSFASILASGVMKDKQCIWKKKSILKEA